MLFFGVVVLFIVLGTLIIARRAGLDTLLSFSKAKPKNFEAYKQEIANYGAVIFPNTQKSGVVFAFPHFKLAHSYYRDLSEHEREQKREASAAGIDGGSSMLSPFNGFEVSLHDGEIVESFELSILPYATHVFAVQGMKFKIQNSGLGWIVHNSK